MGLEQLIDIQVDRQTQVPSQVGFGTPLFLATHSVFAERIRFYSDTDGVVADGFLTSSNVYKAVSAALSQEKKPKLVGVGRRTADVAQVMNVVPSVVTNSFNYQITIDHYGGVSTVIAYLSDGTATAAEISLGLVTAINADGVLGPLVTAVDLVGSFTVTSDFAGQEFTLVETSAGAKLTITTPTANEDITTSLQEVIDENNDFYAVAIESRGQQDVLKMAAFIESKKKIFIACSEEAAVLTAATTDTASLLEASNYFRSAYLWSADEEKYPEMAWMGLVLPNDPGSETWAYKTLAGIAADNHTATQVANLENKNANYYKEYAGLDITLNGEMAGNEWIDVMRGIDWLVARMQERIYGRLVNLVKIPYTNAGIAIIEAEVRAQLLAGERVGLIAPEPPFTVTVPDVLDVDEADRANRLLPDVAFQARLAGAIHKVDINGIVTV